MARRKRAKGEAFALLRRGWDESYGDNWSFRRVAAEESDEPLGRPITVCRDRASAEAHKAELEREARAELNPFLFLDGYDDTLEGASSRSPEEFVAELKSILPKVRLPREGKYGGRDWCTWWGKLADALTDEQRSAVWGLFDRLEFYTIVPVTVE